MSSAEYLPELCEQTAEAARARGHDLDSWTLPAGQDGVARAAVCRRCGRVAYVRAESGFAGAAGEALTQDCEPAG